MLALRSAFPYIATMGIVTPIRITLRAAREAAGLSQAQLAKKANVRQAKISEMETGKRRSVDLGALEKLCRVLKVAPGDLLELHPAVRSKR